MVIFSLAVYICHPEQNKCKKVQKLKCHASQQKHITQGFSVLNCIFAELFGKNMLSNVSLATVETPSPMCPQIQISFLSPPVQFARWAHMHHYLSVCTLSVVWTGPKIRLENNSYPGKYQSYRLHSKKISSSQHRIFC